MKSIKFICDCCGKEIPQQWSDWCDSKYLEKGTIFEEYSWYVVHKRSMLTTGETHTDVVDLCVKCHEKYMDLVKEDTEE